ncbi:S16 family serine protease [Paenibacillus sp. CAU 1782]
MARNESQWKKVVASGAGTALFMWLLLYAPTPFVMFQPGIAVPVEPMIVLDHSAGNPDAAANGEAGVQEAEGEFLLTAVKLTEPNFWNVLKAAFQPDYDLMRKRDVYGGVSRSQYVQQLSVVMQNSQSNAVEAVYRYLSLPYHNVTTVIIASGISPNAGSNPGLLEQGDILVGPKGETPFLDMEDVLRRWEKDIQSGENWELVVSRKGEHLTIGMETLKTAGLTGEWSKDELLEQFAAWLGVAGFVEQQELVPDDLLYKLNISANNIGGPSAGLVFALQGVDLLSTGDLTGGRRIAATGTISPDGAVGEIGGISQKVVSTSSEGAELFLVPAGNEAEARKKAAALHSPMTIAGVSTLQEALDAIEGFIREQS